MMKTIMLLDYSSLKLSFSKLTDLKKLKFTSDYFRYNTKYNTKFT